MELLYVWIEEYNNIHHQGFNFSPKYKFEFTPTTFDEKGKVTGGNLPDPTINNNYPNNFFGKNISNITAIVGKNGSGKSSLVQCILDRKSIIIIAQSNKTIKAYSEGITINSTIEEILEINTEDIIYFSSSLNSNIPNNYLPPKFIDISTDYMLRNAPSDEILNEDTFSFGNRFLAFRNKEKARQVKMLRALSDLGYYFMPEEFWMEFTLNHYDDFLSSFEELDDFFNDTYEGNIIDDFQKSMIIGLIKKRYSSVNPKYAEGESKSIAKELLQLIEKGHGQKEILDYMLKSTKDDLPWGFYQHWTDDFIDFCKKHSEYNSNQTKARVTFETDDFLRFNNNLEFFLSSNLSDILNINLSWRNMSDGEIELLSLFSRLTPQLHLSSQIIILDEPDVRLHPQWQKEIISKLQWLLQNASPDNVYHLILISHSPIMLSDLPHENIIFLDKDADGECVAKEPNDIDRTFGANIHSLYRSSFFMDGLMGKFAEGKINDVIADLKSKRKINSIRKAEIRYIIDMIGEDILRYGLERMYVSKFKLSKREELELKREEINRQLQELEKHDSNKN